MQQEVKGFSVKETITRRIVSKSDSDKCKINVKFIKNHLLHNVCSLQLRVNNLNIQRKKMSFVRFKVNRRILFGLGLINTGNLVHSAIVSGEFWEAIGGKISNSMDNNLKLICTKEEVALKDGSASRVPLVEGGCQSFKG